MPLFIRSLLGCAVFACATFPALAANPERVQAGDENLECAAVQSSIETLETSIRNSGKVSADSRSETAGGLFGVLGKAAGMIAGSVGEQKAAEPGVNTADARARIKFLRALAEAKSCKADQPNFVGKKLTRAEVERLAQSSAAPQPVSAQSLTATPLEVPQFVEGNLDLANKRFYIAEFRLLFDIGGEAKANTRAGYLPGRDTGASRVKIIYNVPNPDLATYQLITDKAYADFKARLAAAGIQVDDAASFVSANGEVYPTTEDASRPGAPVVLDKGRKYLVLSPNGMKTHARGFAGLGAGNIGNRITWSKTGLEALSVSMAVNIAELGSSGNRSSIFSRSAEVSVGEGMSISNPPDGGIAQTHANVTALRIKEPLPVPGKFADFRETGGYDSSKDALATGLGILSNLAGVAAIQSKKIETEVDLDLPEMARLALTGIATVNQAVVDHIKKPQ